MNFIVSGDQHIKVTKDLPLEWQLNRFRMLWQTYLKLCEEHQAILILSGDLLHNAKPNLHETMLLLELFQLLEKNEVVTHVIAGNHENLGTAGTTLDYLQPMFQGLDFVHYHPRISHSTFSDAGKTCELVFVGHNQLQEWLDTYEKWEGTRIVFSHFRCTVNQHIQEEINVSKFLSTGDCVFMGDIHCDLSLAENAVYTNSPLNNHFESNPECGCLLVNAEAGKVGWRRIRLILPNLVQVNVTADQFQDPKDSYNYYRVTVTGTPEDLRKIRTESTCTKLLKVPDTDTTYADLEIVDEVRDQSLEDALIEYMTKHCQFQEEKIQKMLEVFREP